ncbi:MAG TPA: hypothetical protein VFB49_10110 [Patescibacteria group bacterium]|nr:hypothetical protein [Patescibacteria group bacterium]
MIAYASEKVAALDGTSWKLEVGPDSMAKEKGEKEYKETMTFADGMVSMNEAQKVGFASSHYDVAKSGDKDWTFKTEQGSDSMGQSVWTGTIHEKSVEGKMIMTKKDGAVLTYSFKGSKLN